MKDKKILNDIKINFFVTFFIAILGFLSNKYFVKYMGIEYLGLMKLFTQLITYLSLVELGIGTASAYALYKPIEEKDVNQINIVVSTIDSFYKKIGIFILIIGLSMNLFLNYFINHENIGKYIYLYWSMYVLNVSIGYCFAKYTILFTANQEYSFVRKIQGSGKGIFQVLQICSLILIKSFFIFILLLILENLFNFYFYKRHFDKNYNYLSKVKQREKKIIKDMKNLFWHKLGWVIVHNTDYIILSKFVSLSIVGIYSSYMIIYQMIITIINILTGVLTPRIGQFIAKNKKENIYNYWKKLYYNYFFIATIAISCTYKLINPFIYLWIGEKFILPKITIILILTKLFIHITRIIIICFKDLSGFYGDTYSPAIESIINLVISIILVKTYQLNGVLIGTIVANIIVMVFLKPILVFKECFGKKIIDYLRTLSLGLVLSAISIFLSSKILDNIFMNMVLNWKRFIILSILSIIVSSIISIIIFLFSTSFRENLKIINDYKKK